MTDSDTIYILPKGLNPLLSGSVFLTGGDKMKNIKITKRCLNPLLSGSVFLTYRKLWLTYRQAKQLGLNPLLSGSVFLTDQGN